MRFRIAIPSLAAVLSVGVVSAQITEFRLRQERNSHGVALVGGRLAIAGGNGALAGYLDVVEVRSLDGEMLDVWRLSSRRYDVAGVGHNGEFYFGGGCVPPFHESSDRVDIFNAFGTRREIALPVAAARAAAAAVGDIVVFAGGFIPPGSMQNVSAIQILDTVTGQWTLRTIPYSVAFADADGRWLVVAGHPVFGASGHVDIYDSLSRTWTTIPQADVPILPQVALIGGVAYFASFDLSENQIRTLNLETHEWATIVPPFEQAFASVGAAGSFLVRGTGRDPADPSIDYRIIDLFDTATGEWRRTLTNEWASGRAVVSDRVNSAVVFRRRAAVRRRVGPRRRGPRRGPPRAGHARIRSPTRPGSSPRSAYGFREAALDMTTLRATSLPPSAFGVFLVAGASAHVPVSGVGGDRLGGPLGILRPLGGMADTAGVLRGPLDLRALPFPSPIAVRPGDTWWFQAWHRDSLATGERSVLTDAISVRFE